MTTTHPLEQLHEDISPGAIKGFEAVTVVQSYENMLGQDLSLLLNINVQVHCRNEARNATIDRRPVAIAVGSRPRHCALQQTEGQKGPPCDCRGDGGGDSWRGN